jgi:enoyl-CoA hydratase
MNAEAELVVERRGHVLVARLNRPDARNALTPTLIGALGAALREGESDPEVRAVVLTGTGDRAFCAGMDLRAFASGGFDLDDDENTDAYVRLLRGRIQIPVIGAANGTAVAGGLELLLGCDLIVVAAGAKLGVPEVRRGLVAAGGGVFIANRVPLSIALELLLTGDPIDAARAGAIGLANAVVPADEVLAVALGYADRIAANGPLAVRATKELAHLGVADAEAGWRRLGELQPAVFASEDATEGARAFVEKRPPVWRGR